MKPYTFLLLCVCLVHYAVCYGQLKTGDNTPPESITYRSIPKGKLLYGVFEGRPPCSEIAKQLKIAVAADCIKLKWRLFLFHDENGKPANFHLYGAYYREENREGKWRITRGSKTDPEAVIYELDYDRAGKSFYFLKGDDNVLFILDEQKAFRVGNEDFSYTLNRVKLIQRPASELK